MKYGEMSILAEPLKHDQGNLLASGLGLLLSSFLHFTFKG